MANSDSNPQELRAALAALKPYFKKAGWMALIASVLLLAPSGYMLEVYDRVVLKAGSQKMESLRDLAQARYVYLLSKLRLTALAGLAVDESIFEINSVLSEAN